MTALPTPVTLAYCTLKGQCRDGTSKLFIFAGLDQASLESATRTTPRSISGMVQGKLSSFTAIPEPEAVRLLGEGAGIEIRGAREFFENPHRDASSSNLHFLGVVNF